VFVRVTISPGEQHDATLFISFSKPCKVLLLMLDFPEYVFYNETSYTVDISHKPKKRTNKYGL